MHAKRQALLPVSTCIVESVERQKELKSKTLELQTRRFKFQLSCAEKKDERLDCAQCVAKHKRVLEEKLFALDK